MSRTADDITAIAEVLADAVPDATIDALVRDLRALHRGAALDFSLEVARLLVDRLYAGDLEVWKQRGPKDGSFRKLAAKLDPLDIPGLSSGSLARAIYVLELDTRVGIVSRPQLTLSHALAVAGLPEAEQERMLGEAEARDLSVAALRREADDLRRANSAPGRKGRPRLPAFVRTVNRWQRELEDEAASFGDLEQAAALDADDARRMRDVVESMRARCEALLAQLPS